MMYSIYNLDEKYTCFSKTFEIVKEACRVSDMPIKRYYKKYYRTSPWILLLRYFRRFF